MTKQDLENMRVLRESNYSFPAIAEALDMNENSVRAICSKNNFKPISKRKRPLGKPSICPYCGKMVTQTSAQTKRFCNDRCRLYHWRSKQNDLKRK